MEETTQFLVQWEEHPSHLATRLGYLLEHQSLVDVTLMCNTHTLKVHRAVLAACSPYFERQLGNHPLIVLKDMKFSVLKSLVEFMYCGETSVSEENLSSLLEAAKFFEVKGLSSMTKESVRGPNSSNAIKSFNGPITPTTSAPYGRNCSGRGGRGRGRGRPPANNPTTKIGSPTESAQILLSLSGNNPPTAAATPSPQLYTTSKNVKIDPSLIQQSSSGGSSSSATFNSMDKSKMGGFEPRRRGRKRGAINMAFRDRLMRDADTTHMPNSLETLKRDLSDDSEQMCSPLLNSLLTKGEGKKGAGGGCSGGGATTPSPASSSSSSSSPRVSDPPDNSKYFQTLKEFGLPTNVPILMDNGEGKYVALNEDVLKSVMESDGNLQFQVTESSALVDSQGFLNQVVAPDDKRDSPDKLVNKQKKPPPSKPFVQISRSDDDKDMIPGCKLKKEIPDESELINEDLFEDIKTGAATEAEMVPDAVVLFEVTDNKKIEKYVVSAREVSMLKSLNEQLTKQNKELADITADAKIDTVGSNTKVAELKVKIGRTKSILSKFVNCTQGLQERLKNVAKMYMNGNTNPSKLSQSQVVQLEFIDGNGEKIEGYQVQGTVVDKRLSETKEVRHKENDLLGLFDIVCPGSEGAIIDKKRRGRGSTMLSGRGDDSLQAKEMSYQMVMNNNLSDHHDTINYDQIEAMIEDPAGNIVIEDKGQDLKYIIDNEGNLMNHDDNYVVYEDDKGELGGGEYVIYDNHDGVIPDMTDSDNSRGFVVGAETEVIQNDDGTEYIVYDGSKGELSDHIKEMSDSDVGSQYIVYTSEEGLDKPPDEYDAIEDGVDLGKEHEEFVMSEEDIETVIVKEELPETNGEGESPVKDVPFAVGLLPLKDALEKFQSISEHQPRKTRSESIGSRRRSSVNSDSSDKSIGSKKVKLDPTLADGLEVESL